MIMDSVSDPCEMKLLMLSTKISEIILHPVETKAEGGMKMGKKQGIHICLKEKDSIYREKIIILGVF